jgi:hypothetical protein
LAKSIFWTLLAVADAAAVVVSWFFRDICSLLLLLMLLLLGLVSGWWLETGVILAGAVAVLLVSDSAEEGAAGRWRLGSCCCAGRGFLFATAYGFRAAPRYGLVVDDETDNDDAGGIDGGGSPRSRWK